MEQKFGVSGLQSLDPMRFWKYVMVKKRESSCVVIYGYIPERLFVWAKENPQVKFIVESDTIPGEIPVFIPNVTYRWLTSMSYDEWLERWKWTDYVLCNEKVPEYWVQAQLCGVQPLFEEESLEATLKNIQPLELVKRIENWETAKDYLTRL